MSKGMPANSFGDAHLHGSRPDVMSQEGLSPEWKLPLANRTGENPVCRLTEAGRATPSTKSSDQTRVQGHRLLRCFGLTWPDCLFDNGSQDADLFSGEVYVSPLLDRTIRSHAKARTRSQENKSPLSVTQTGNESVDFGRQKYFWYCAPFRALTDEGDGIAFDEVVSSRMIKEHAHQIPNLGATGSGEWKRPEPQFNLDCPDRAEIS